MQPTLLSNAMLGAYRLTERIGKGGFSEVWSAWDTHLNRLVAIKIIPRTSSDAHNTIQFGREAAMITRLEHPHVLPLYDFGETPELRFLVMRYVTGGSLAQRIEHHRLPIVKTLQLMKPIAETLDYIHDQRVVHRDLKPANILLDAQDAPYLADFGLAKVLTDETRPVHSASGTLTYMPPEQFSGGILSVKSDIFSFGVLLYQLFTGQLPYEGQYALGMRQIAKHDLLEDATHLNPDLPATLNDVLRRLTDPDPLRRPESAAAVLQHITELLYGPKTIVSTTAPTAQGITLALESGAYREREAEGLIQPSLAFWQKGEFSLSATHFVLLDILLRDLQKLLTPDVRSMMLRGALEHDHQVDYWRAQCTDAERQKACSHALLHGNDTVRLKAIQLALNARWIRDATPEMINAASTYLMPPSDATVLGLQFLEQALPPRSRWVTDESLRVTDDQLCALALSRSPVAEGAAMLIGRMRRTRAMLGLIGSHGSVSPALTAFETARGLPDTLTAVQRFRLSTRLAFRQLTRQPLKAFREYLWAAGGNVLAFGMMIYVVFRAQDPLNFLYEKRVLNGLALGLLYGLLLAMGIWAARHIAQRLRIVPFAVRVVIGIAIGGLIAAEGFSLYQQYVYLDVIDPATALGSGLLYVIGFAISVKLPTIAQWLISAVGVAGAFLLPWYAYLANPDLRPPFIFDETAPQSAVPLVLSAALLLAILALGYRWRPLLQRALERTHPPSSATVRSSGK